MGHGSVSSPIDSTCLSALAMSPVLITVDYLKSNGHSEMKNLKLLLLHRCRIQY